MVETKTQIYVTVQILHISIVKICRFEFIEKKERDWNFIQRSMNIFFDKNFFQNLYPVNPKMCLCT